jgi:pseudouridine synthase
MSRRKSTIPRERVQKIIAQAGITSRRKAEDMIRAGRVVINGEVAVLGSKAALGVDEIMVDGQAIVNTERKVSVRLHKPRGYITAVSDDVGRPVVVDLIKGIPERLFPVGRLDYDTEGVLLLTNDGQLAHALTHPKFEIPRTYHVKVRRTPTAAALRQLEEGVRLEDGMAKAVSVQKLHSTQAGNSWIEIVLTEGRNREVRRMCDAIGHRVMRLKRVRFGTIHVEDLLPGDYQVLSKKDIKELYALTGIHNHNAD